MHKVTVGLAGLALFLSACSSLQGEQRPATEAELSPQGGCAPINIALNKPATASSTEQGWLGAGNAVDEDYEASTHRTRWSSDFNDNQWIQVDLGRSWFVCNVILKWEGAAAYGKDYEIQVSDDAETWTPIYRTTGRTGGTDTLTPAGNVAGRYVRMQGVRRGNGYGYSLFDFQVYPAGGDVIAPPPPAPTTYSGSLPEGGGTTWEPGLPGFTYSGGTLRGTLTHDSGFFRLFLQRAEGVGWLTVARDTGFGREPSNTKSITYEAVPGTYRWQISSDGSSGKYGLFVEQ